MSAAYRIYIDNVQHNISADPKKLWEYIQSKKGSTRIPKVVTDEKHSSHETPDDIVNSFASYFKSVYAVPDTISANVSPELNHSPQHVVVTNITFDEIISSIKFLKNKQTAGPEQIQS